MKRSILAIALLAASSIALAGGNGGPPRGPSLQINGGNHSSYNHQGNATYAASGVDSSAATYSRTDIAAGPGTELLTVNGALALTGGIAGATAHTVEYCRYTEAGALAGGLAGSLSVTGGYVDIDGNGTVTSVNEAGASTDVYAHAGVAEWDLSGRQTNRFWLNVRGLHRPGQVVRQTAFQQSKL